MFLLFRFPLTRIRCLFFCPCIFLPIGRGNFSPVVLSFVSYHRYHRRVSFLFRLVSFSFSFFLSFFFQIHPYAARYNANAEHREHPSFSLSLSLTIFTHPFASQLDVTSAWHYFPRLSDVIFHRSPRTLNVTPESCWYSGHVPDFSPDFFHDISTRTFRFEATALLLYLAPFAI